MSGLFATALLLAISTSGSSYQAQEMDIKLFKWIADTGKPTVIRANVSKVLGFGERDVSVRERGFRRLGERFTHVLAVITEPNQSHDVVIARIDESDGSGITWYCSPSGRLLLTVVLDGNGSAGLVLNGKYESELSAEKRYFTRKFLEASRSIDESSNTEDKPHLAEIGKAHVTRPRKRVLGSEMTALMVYAPWSFLGLAIIFYLGVLPPNRNRK